MQEVFNMYQLSFTAEQVTSVMLALAERMDITSEFLSHNPDDSYWKREREIAVNLYDMFRRALPVD